MIFGLLVIESIVMCFDLLILCVVGTANGAVGLVTFFEKDVQKRVVELGLTTEEKIKKSTVISSLVMFIPLFFAVPLMVYKINGADSFFSGFWQMTFIMEIMNLFDRLFIDWYWVGKTKAWEIAGTEDLKPYIPKKTLIIKWSSILLYPVLSAIIAGIVEIL
ncbi:MAG: hypothetical protein MJ100_06930 [Ruminococcus sp.]|nr:hypothetical protein [Ruminococcus sp.]